MTTLADTLTKYLTAVKAEGLSGKSIKTMEQRVWYFNNYLGGIADVRQVTADDLRAFINALRQKKRWSNHPNIHNDKPLSPFTIRSYIRSVKVYWNWLLKEGYLAANPLQIVKLPKVPDKIMETLSGEEIAAILDEIDATTMTGFRDRTLFLLLLDTGARISEVTNLKLENIDLEQSHVKVIGKGNRERILPVGKKVARLLAKWQKKYRPNNPDGYFFTTIRGGPLTSDRMRHVLATCSLKALGKRVHPHQFRHTAAVQWLRNNGNPFHLQKLLGHRQITTTKLYVNLVDADVKLAHKKYGIVDHMRF